MRREFPSAPLVGVAAAVFDGPQVLLVKRGREPERGKWSLPGGLVELGEELGEALKRELLEETALEIQVGGLVGVYDRIIRAPDGRVRFHYVLLDYWARPLRGEVVAGSDTEAVRWASLNELQRLEVSGRLRNTVEKADQKQRASS